MNSTPGDDPPPNAGHVFGDRDPLPTKDQIRAALNQVEPGLGGLLELRPVSPRDSSATAHTPSPLWSGAVDIVARRLVQQSLARLGARVDVSDTPIESLLPRGGSIVEELVIRASGIPMAVWKKAKGGCHTRPTRPGSLNPPTQPVAPPFLRPNPIVRNPVSPRPPLQTAPDPSVETTPTIREPPAPEQPTLGSDGGAGGSRAGAPGGVQLSSTPNNTAVPLPGKRKKHTQKVGVDQPVPADLARHPKRLRKPLHTTNPHDDPDVSG